MTSAAKAKMINDAVSGPRGEFAREKGLVAEVVGGKLIYTAKPRGRVIKITFAEALSFLHGEDIRAIKAAI